MGNNRKISNAKGLYLEGIRDGDIHGALDKYTGERYTQHSTGVADGKEGFAAFFAPFLERTPVRDIQVIRAIEDGQYVFCHAYQNLNNGEAQWVTADLFDTDADDRLIEHWDVIQEYAEDTASGRSMVDGPSDIEDLDQTEANKAVVGNFIRDVLQSAAPDKITDYVSVEQYDQHNPQVKDGLDGLGEYMAAMAEAGSSMEYVQVHRLIGQGNFVVSYSHMRLDGEDHAVFDIFRLKSGKIVEHWDIMEKIGPEESWNNSGKF